MLVRRRVEEEIRYEIGGMVAVWKSLGGQPARKVDDCEAKALR